MKTATRPCIFTLFLISCLLALQPVSARADGAAIIPALSFLLLSADSHADTIEEVNVPDDFDWETTKDITVNISLLSTSASTDGKLYADSMNIKFYRATSDDPALTRLITTVPSINGGITSTSISIPSAATQLKIVAMDLSDDPPFVIVDLDDEVDFDIDINLHNSDPGEGEGEVYQ